MPMFHNGNRELQDAFGSRALADRLVERLRRSEFTDDDCRLPVPTALAATSIATDAVPARGA